MPKPNATTSKIETVEPIGNRVLIRKDEDKKKTKTGIHLPDKIEIPTLTGRVVATALGEGVFFYPGGCDPARDVVVMGPPFTIGDQEIELIADTLERAINSAVRGVA